MICPFPRVAAALSSRIALAVLACLVTHGWSTPATADPTDSPALGVVTVAPGSPVQKALELAVIKVQPVARTLAAPGVVEGDPARIQHIVPPVSGRIIKLGKKLGDVVAKGDLLLTLDSPEVAEALADHDKATAALELYRRAQARQHELLDADIAARRDVEQADNDFATASAELRRADGRLQQLGITDPRHATRSYELRATTNGVVIELACGEGVFWNDTSAAVMTIADLSTVWVAASVPERDVASVAVGKPATVLLNAYPNEALQGSVGYLGAILEPDTRTIKARIAIANQDGRLRPGMFARVEFLTAEHDAPVVPLAALVQRGFDTEVYVKSAENSFVPRTVRLGIRTADGVEIVEGLHGGEDIVVRNAVLLSD